MLKEKIDKSTISSETNSVNVSFRPREVFDSFQLTIFRNNEDLIFLRAETNVVTTR